MHCFASKNQIYTGTVVFGVESLKGPIFCREEHFFVEKYGIQSTNEITITVKPGLAYPPIIH